MTAVDREAHGNNERRLTIDSHSLRFANMVCHAARHAPLFIESSELLIQVGRRPNVCLLR